MFLKTQRITRNYYPIWARGEDFRFLAFSFIANTNHRGKKKNCPVCVARLVWELRRSLLCLAHSLLIERKGSNGGYSGSSSNQSYTPRLKLNFPRFNGTEDPTRVISSVFTRHQLKTKLRWLPSTSNFVDWTTSLLTRYGPTQFYDYFRMWIFNFGQITYKKKKRCAILGLPPKNEYSCCKCKGKCKPKKSPTDMVVRIDHFLFLM